MGLPKDAGAGGRPEPQDADVGRKAVELGLITASQLANVLLQFEDAPAKAKKPTSLCAALVTGGLLTQRQIDILVEGNAAAPTQVGKYRIVKELGRGGMGVVYEAEDVQLHRRVALKMLLGSLHADPQETALEEERFIRESRLSANLPKHPHLVGVYEAGTESGRHFIAMEFVDGRQFSDWRRGGSITIRQQIIVLREVAMAVDHAHRHGVIHRDLKPQNILVDSKNVPHVTDFGLAKRASRQATLSLTASGLVMGTPAYMAPEQAEGKKDVDRRADIWALGVMLYEILTGRLPFAGQTPIEILMKTVKDPVPPPSSFFPRGSHATLDQTIEDICLKALAKDPKDRYTGAKAFAEDLTRWLKGQKIAVKGPRQKVPRSWVIWGAVAAGLLVAAIAYLALGDSSSDRAARVEDYILEGRRHIQNRRYGDAIVAFGRAIAEDPNSRAAKAGKKEAEEKLIAAARPDKPTPSAPVDPPKPPPAVPPDSDAELHKRELVEIDTAIHSLIGAESFGSAREFLDQAAKRHGDADWKNRITWRQNDVKKSVANLLATLKEEAAQAKRRSDHPTVGAVRSRVDRWKWPEALVELEESLDKVGLAEAPKPASAVSETFLAHSSGVHVLALLPDGKTLLTGSFDKKVRLWDVETRKERRVLANEWPVMASASADGRWFGVGFLDATLRIWDTATLQSRTFPGHKSQVMGVVFSPDGKWACSASTDGVARFWDMASGTMTAETGGFPLGIMCLAISQDGKMVAAGAAERLVRILDMPSGKERKLFEQVHDCVYYLTFSPDGKQLVTAGKDQTTVLFDIASGRRKTLAKMSLGANFQIRQVAYTPDGRHIVVATSDGLLTFFDAASGATVRTVSNKNNGFFSLVFNRKGDVMITGLADGHVAFWDVKSFGLPK
jgi:eukaryotic-like serine/threonine-protein kinase